MKKILCLLCFFLSITVLCSCSKKVSVAHTPVNFYYRNSVITYNTDDGVIAAEVRDAAEYDGTTDALIRLYLEGPVSDTLVLPAEGITLDRSLMQEKVCRIYLSGEFDRLQGIDQTLSGACLAKTVMEITGAEAIEIFCDDGTGQQTPVLTFNRDSLLLIDDAQ